MTTTRMTTERVSESEIPEPPPKPTRFRYQQTRKVIPPERDESYSVRVLSKVPLPSRKVLDTEEVFNIQNLPNLKVLEDHFSNEGRIHIDAALQILTDAKTIFTKEPTLLTLQYPITIAGDIHGQFYDLLTLFKIGGPPSRTTYLFLGDYVDRGYFGVEVILLLFSLKITYPKSMFLLRGNHETRQLTKLYTFKRECEIKYNHEFYLAAMEAFDSIPLAAIIESKVLCMHGGISPTIDSLDDITNIERFCEPPLTGSMCDLLWSDPLPNYDDNETVQNFRPNTVRYVSYYFSYGAMSAFLKRNKLVSVIRAHEVVTNGFKLYKKLDECALPSLITIFSAPNYNDQAQNKAAIIQFDRQGISIKQFAAVQHPFWLPNFENAINFTLPFIAEHTTNLLVGLLRSCIEGVPHYMPAKEVDRDIALKRKIRIFGRVALIFEKYRKGMMLQARLPGGSENPNMEDALTPAVPVHDGTFQSIEKYLRHSYPETCFEEDACDMQVNILND